MSPEYCQSSGGSSNYQTAGSPFSDPNLRQVLATSETPSQSPTPALSQSASRLPRGQLTPLFITNNKQITLDYEVKRGPSGVGKVDLWVTKDDGRTWEWYAENRELKPPMVVDLPGEGVYGFCLIVQNRAGIGKKPPVSGDAPELRVEVNTTPPGARLRAPTRRAAARFSRLELVRDRPQPSCEPYHAPVGGTAGRALDYDKGRPA